MEAVNILLIAINICVYMHKIDASGGCASPQYIELGTRGTVVCSFNGSFYGVIWYTSKEYITEESPVYLTEFVKKGKGYNSGEFDIHIDGSLIINNVSLNHNHYFTVVKLSSPTDKSVPHFIDVIVVVKPRITHPVINICESESTLCFWSWKDGQEIVCSVQDTRPAVTLSWKAKLSNEDRNISADMLITKNGILSKTWATINNTFLYSSALRLLVCKAECPKMMLKESEAQLIVHNGLVKMPLVEASKKNAELYSRVELPCHTRDVLFFVWRYRKKMSDPFLEISWAALNTDKWTTVSSVEYEIGTDGSLVIANLSTDQAGRYACMYGNGTAHGVIEFDLSYYVLPNPRRPIVKGCSNGSSCILTVHDKGTLTCTICGIWPRVQIGWRVLQENPGQNDISFVNEKTTITYNMKDTLDITLVSEYDASFSTNTNFNMECIVSHPEIKAFNISSGVKLLLLKVKMSRKRAAIQEKKPEAENALLEIKNDEKKDTLVAEIKGKYAALCEQVHPIPYVREKMYNVNRVFVEGGLKYLDKDTKPAIQETWQEMKSYHAIFNDPRLKSKRRIVEGEPGYGKSTLALQIAYDWCNSSNTSSLDNAEICIILNLKQYGAVNSFFKAVKLYLLPTDTSLNEHDIESVIRKSHSVLIILDGFDELPGSVTNSNSDVFDIINGNRFQQMDVIITTRSSCLPDELAPHALRIRMTGFDEKARQTYIRKAIVGDDIIAEETINRKLRDNPFLCDLCEVPLFFVLFVHVCSGEERVPKFATVTQFFSHIISCLHSHMKSKLLSDEVQKYNFYERNHGELDKIAFEALLVGSKSMNWDKCHLRKICGADLYDQYVKSGILIEEDVLSLPNDLTLLSEKAVHRMEVRFYHKLFCEWYAAHYLSKYAADPGVELDLRKRVLCSFKPKSDNERSSVGKEESLNLQKELELETLDPFECQYVYRFACGLKAEAAEKIYGYLKTVYGGDKFEILCVLEQTENLERFHQVIENLCSKQLMIHGEYSRLHQRSTIQLLEFASRQGISITEVLLRNCFKSVDKNGSFLQLTSDVKFVILNTLEKIIISQDRWEFSETDIGQIFVFCSKCPVLQSLKFEHCVMPKTVPPDSISVLKTLPIRVFCVTRFADTLTLNLRNGQWETTSM